MKNKLMELFKDKNLELYFDELLKNHTSFKIGGPADAMIIVHSENDIVNAIKICRENNLEYFIMGNGTNLLIRDSGMRKVVIKIASGFEKIEIEDNIIIADAGALLSTISKRALANNLEGFEFAGGIPGTIGGAITMNAGAYGGEMKDIVKRVKVLDLDNNIRYIDNGDMDFRYRGSKVVDEKLIVLGVEIELTKGNYEDIKSKMDDFTNRRKTKQPLEMASAGSTFKRPEGYFAGQLIDESGLRGLKYGDAQVSEKHCGFVVNTGNSNFEEISSLIETVQKIVFDKYGVKLETEIKIIGDKDEDNS